MPAYMIWETEPVKPYTPRHSDASPRPACSCFNPLPVTPNTDRTQHNALCQVTLERKRRLKLGQGGTR